MHGGAAIILSADGLFGRLQLGGAGQSGFVKAGVKRRTPDGFSKSTLGWTSVAFEIAGFRDSLPPSTLNDPSIEVD